MLTNQVQRLNQRLTAVELQDVSINTVISKINKFYNSLKFGMELITLNYRIGQSPVCGESTLCSDTTLTDAEVYKITNPSPTPSLALVKDNVYNETNFLNAVFSVIHNNTQVTKVSIVLTDNEEYFIDFTINDNKLEINIKDIAYNYPVHGFNLYDENDGLIFSVTYNDIIIDVTKSLNITLLINYEQLNASKLYSNLSNSYQTVISNAIKEYLDNNLTHLAVGDATLVGGYIEDFTEITRKPIMKDVFDDTLTGDVFFDVDELNYEGESNNFTAVRYYLNATGTAGSGVIAFTIIDDISKKDDENLTLSVEIDTEVR